MMMNLNPKQSIYVVRMMMNLNPKQSIYVVTVLHPILFVFITITDDFFLLQWCYFSSPFLVFS
jgi:hypothetical protein